MSFYRWRKAFSKPVIIKIKNLKLKTIVGIFDWERTEKQDVIINAEIEFDGAKAANSDNIEDTVDYKKINKKIIEVVESSKFFLLEKLADTVLKIIMEDKKVIKAKVEVDKPGALRFADSVSIECDG